MGVARMDLRGMVEDESKLARNWTRSRSDQLRRGPDGYRATRLIRATSGWSWSFDYVRRKEPRRTSLRITNLGGRCQGP